MYNYFILARGSALSVHNPKYTAQLIYDSTVGLDAQRNFCAPRHRVWVDSEHQPSTEQDAVGARPLGSDHVATIFDADEHGSNAPSDQNARRPMKGQRATGVVRLGGYGQRRTQRQLGPDQQMARGISRSTRTAAGCIRSTKLPAVQLPQPARSTFLRSMRVAAL